jgi:hypothetical protein
MVIHVDVIPHKNQRYSTCGDWQFLGGGLHVSVSDTGSLESNFLVAIHELVEAFLCHTANISEASVDEFDMSHPELEEPGESPSAPYNRQHAVAEIVERMVAHAAGVNWQEHGSRIDLLFGDGAAT